MKIIDLVKDQTAHFLYYRDGQFMYQIGNGFTFPIPLSDIGTATLKDQDKAIFFMRWIRRHLDVLDADKRSVPTLVTNTVNYYDRLNTTCTNCKAGVYCETSINDDQNGIVHCNICDHAATKYSLKL